MSHNLSLKVNKQVSAMMELPFGISTPAILSHYPTQRHGRTYRYGPCRTKLFSLYPQPKLIPYASFYNQYTIPCTHPQSDMIQRRTSTLEREGPLLHSMNERALIWERLHLDQILSWVRFIFQVHCVSTAFMVSSKICFRSTLTYMMRQPMVL